MKSIDNTELADLMQELRAEVRTLAERVAALERHAGAVVATAAATAAAPAATAVTAAPAGGATAAAAPPVRPEPTEEDLLVIAAAVAAFLGVRARIRQVRLIQSTAWAQVGRATVHASHRVH
jgi:methylmalonyl-CoA carboxyltransferase large subunit